MASASISKDFARSMSLSSFPKPSSSEYSLWVCRWTKSAIELGLLKYNAKFDRVEPCHVRYMHAAEKLEKNLLRKCILSCIQPGCGKTKHFSRSRRPSCFLPLLKNCSFSHTGWNPATEQAEKIP